VYLYAGHDEAGPADRGFQMRDWRLYSSSDLATWTPHGAPMSVRTFAWARGDAWASQVVERGGRFYWYATLRHATVPGFSIGVGVADRPEGPFADARGSALVTNDMTHGALLDGREIDWDDIDPTVFVDDDGRAYLFWGNTKLRYARLKANMTELDGPIVDVDVPRFTEAPWVHKRGGTYYLSYAYGFPERIAYATADRVTGPYTFRGVINDTIPRSPTNHQAIVEFGGRSWFFYHNAALPGGGEFRRSVAVEELHYDPDGSIRPVVQTVGPRPAAR
jgi:beta-xylosidase